MLGAKVTGRESRVTALSTGHSVHWVAQAQNWGRQRRSGLGRGWSSSGHVGAAQLGCGHVSSDQIRVLSWGQAPALEMAPGESRHPGMCSHGRKGASAGEKLGGKEGSGGRRGAAGMVSEQAERDLLGAEMRRRGLWLQLRTLATQGMSEESQVSKVRSEAQRRNRDALEARGRQEGAGGMGLHSLRVCGRVCVTCISYVGGMFVHVYVVYLCVPMHAVRAHKCAGVVYVCYTHICIYIMYMHV